MTKACIGKQSTPRGRGAQRVKNIMYFQKAPSTQGKSWRLRNSTLCDEAVYFHIFLHISVGSLTHLTMEVILESVSEGTFDLRSVGIMVYLGVNLS